MRLMSSFWIPRMIENIKFIAVREYLIFDKSRFNVYYSAYCSATNSKSLDCKIRKRQILLARIAHHILVWKVEARRQFYVSVVRQILINSVGEVNKWRIYYFSETYGFDVLIEKGKFCSYIISSSPSRQICLLLPLILFVFEAYLF